MTDNNSFKKFSYVAFGRIVAIGLQTVFFIMFATILNPESFGEMSYIISLAATFAIISRFGLSQTIVVYQAKGDNNAANQANVLAVITTGIAAIILIPINIFSAFLCIALTFIAMNQQNFLGLKNYKKYFLVSIVKGILIIPLSLLFYFILDIPGIVLGLALGNLLYSFHFLKTLNKKIDSFNHLKNNFKVLIHNFGVESSISLSRWIDKLLVVPLFGFALVGLYQFNIQILFGLTILPLALHSFLLSEESSGSSHKKISILVLSGALVAVLLVIIISPILISEFFPKYIDGVIGLQIMVISLIPFSLTGIITAKLQAKNSTKVGFSALSRIVSLLILLAILGNMYGIMGLAFAVLVSSIIEVVSLYFIYKNSTLKNEV